MAAHTIRILGESKDSAFNVRDAATLQPPFYWRGNDVRLEVALSTNGAFLTAAQIGTITVVVKALDAGPDDSPVMLKTIAAAACDATFTASKWTDGTGQLFVAEWTRAEAGIAAGDYSLVISHDDPSGDRSTHLRTKLTVREDQHDSVSLSAPPTPTVEYYTKPESDSRFEPLTEEKKPLTVLVIGQSNIANGRPGGTIVFNPEVKIWTVAENPNATVDEFQPWDLSLDPPQHSHPAQSGVGVPPIPDPDYQKWSHVLANKLQRITRRPVHIVQAAESGRSIDYWITTANGGSQEWWDWIVQESADAGISRYDYLFFDHGESGTLALANYETAMRALRQQLEDAGFIDDSTIFLSREVTAGLVNSQAAALVFITERNGNGNMIDRDLLTVFDDGSGLHIDGESHELVAQYHLDWILSRYQTHTVLNFDNAVPTVHPQGLFLVQSGNGFLKIPAIEFTANPYPATPDLVFYGEDYVATSEELAGGLLTLKTGATEPTVDTPSASLRFPAADSQFETAAALLSNTGDWLVGFRMRITESGVARRDIFQQYTFSDAERMTFRLVSGIFTYYGNGSGGALTIPSSNLIAVNEWVTVLVEKSGNTVNVTVDDTTDSGSVTGLATQQRAFEISITGNPLRGDLRKFIVYNRAVSATEKTAVKTWLDSL